MISGTAGKDPKVLSVNKKGYTGKGIRIAVSDTGVEITHEDLVDNMLKGEHRNYGLEGSSWIGDPQVSDGHGTSVAGLIGAVGGNGMGSRGVAYGAQIAGFRFLDMKISLSKYIDQANGNFDIFNYSYGYYTCVYRWYVSAYVDQLKYGVTNLRGGKGAIYVMSSGNDWLERLSYCDSSISPYSYAEKDRYFGNSTLYGLHNFPWMIVVGAFNADGVRAYYSRPGSSLWISAPAGRGGNVKPAMITVDLTGCDHGYSNAEKGRNSFNRGEVNLNSNCNYTSTFNGTSAAAPVVSGIIALILEANANLTWRDVKYILASTADQLESGIGNTEHFYTGRKLAGHIYLPDWITNTAGFKFHNYYGFGGINADASVAMAENYTSSLGVFMESAWTDSGALSLNVPDASATGLSHSINITGDMTIEAVQIEVSATHPRVSDLGWN